MKQRLSSLDVRAIAHELQQSLVTLRLSNIYDLSSKIFLLRFAKPDVKKQLIIDSGFRCHLTDFSRPTAPAPSQFVARVRKFLRTRRCTAVSQVGTDRIIELQFSDGSLRLFFEFFASGNIILTDADLNILALLRNVKEGEGQEPQRVGLTYSLDNRLNFGGVPAFTKERLRDALETTVKKAAAAAAAPKKGKRAGGDLRRGLATTISELPPILVDHAFKENNFDPKAKPADILEDECVFDALFKALERARGIIDDITSSDTVKGYIVAKNPDQANTGAAAEGAVVKPFAPDSSKGLLYEDFSPFLPEQFAGDPSNVVLTFEGFNKTVDEFFSSVEGQKLESRLTEREAAAKRKLDAAKREHEKRIEGLQEYQLLNLRKAAAIEANVERVQEAMDAVIGLLEQGMDWVDVGKLVEREQKRQNPVAEIIKLPMDLANNTITLVIAEQDEVDDDLEDGYETESSVSDDDDDTAPVQTGKAKTLEVDIKLNLTPWSNAGEYYDQKRSAAVKQEKTVQQSSIALKSAQEKIAKDLQKGLKKEKPVMQLVRRQMWFEKFHWFISSDGYLVLGGRDAQQNEILYRRYLKRGDVYVHADLHGAPSVIIKNSPRTPDAPVPPSTLSQAGQLAVCASGAWESKAGMGAYWVGADQVSKSAPTGEFLPTGSFMVRGKRNELPPAPLILGFGVMFRISDESKAKHTRHRVYGPVESESSTAPELSPEMVQVGAGDDISPQDAVGEDYESDSDPEDKDDGVGSARANPLQSGAGNDEEVGGKSDDEETAPPTEPMAELQVSSKPDTEEADASENRAGDGDDDDAPDKGDQSEDDEAESVVSTPATSVAPPVQQKKGPLKRGQRAKAKKMAAKYKYQDDEDRAAAEALLGAAAGRLKREAEAKAKAEEEAAFAAARERRKEQLKRQQQATAAHEEARRRQMEEAGGDGEDGDGDGDSGGGGGPTELSTLDSLVGTPQASDEILEVIPVCAPYAAMARVKYKAKLQPGMQKKGKALKEIIESWKAASGKKGVVDDNARDPERMWPREVELIKAIKPEEANNCVPVGKVKVMMSGGAGGGKGGGGGGGGSGGGKGGKGNKKR
ncbi:hypothetical protein RB595_009941 [Gaeumannomyces hyphopodioides]